jgi:hypothetical protein
MRLNAFPLEDAEIRRKQQFYAESILALGEGRDHPHAIRYTRKRFLHESWFTFG